MIGKSFMLRRLERSLRTTSELTRTQREVSGADLFRAYCSRIQFLTIPAFNCEATGKSSLTYPAALASETRESRLLHTRFPTQLKRAVLEACQFRELICAIKVIDKMLILCRDRG